MLTALLRPLRGHVGRIADRADREAQAAGLTVEMLPGGRRRYRDSRFGQRVVGRVGERVDGDAELWSAPTLVVATAGWSR
jgi:hypothetical protein